MPCLVVIGSGPGIGIHVARRFAREGFDIALLARSDAQLQKDKATVGEARVVTHAVDVTDGGQLVGALDGVFDEIGPPTVVFFNAARVQGSRLLEEDDEQLVYDFKISTVALHNVAKWAMPHLTRLAADDAASKPSLLVTTSHLTKTPEPDVFVLSLAKAAQRNLAESLAQVYWPQGVHVGLVVVAGLVAPENKVLSPANIADQTWALYHQDRDSWKLDVYLEEPH